MIRQIYRILEKFACHNVTTGEAVPLLTYDNPKKAFPKKFYPDAQCLSIGGSDATLEELVQLCDQNAESINAHDFCGTHRLLGAVLYSRYGRKSATATMLEIAKFGGLHGMSGVCIKGHAYAELGMGKINHDWDGSYGK